MHARTRRWQQMLSAALLFAMLFTSFPAPALVAQDAPGVVILPVDRAQFLPGAYFDLRIEVHADAMPADFAVTVNGGDAAEFFGADAELDSWSFGDEDDETAVQAATWRQVTLPAAGEYSVEVTAGGEATAVNWEALEPGDGEAQNVILFIADGMTVPMITAARLLAVGNTAGKYDGKLAMDQMEEIGLVSTSSLNTIMANSANAASALNTGHKSAGNAIGVYTDSSSDALDDPRVETFAELAQRVAGKAIGIVTTADWTDVTSAAVFAHTRRRADSEYISAAALDEGMLPEVILGGGARWMFPDALEGGARTDGRNLFAAFEAADYTIATSSSELTAAMAGGAPTRLLGIFHPSHMNVWLDRNVFTDNLGDFTDQPGLVDMTLAALDVLSQSEDGFYLMVEAASVDKQMHMLDWERAIADLIEFDQALAAAVAWTQANAPDTLIVVTADHAHGFDVYGTVDVERFNAGADDTARRAAIQAHDAAGFPTYADADGDGFPDAWDVAVTLAAAVNNHPDYTEDFQVSPAPRIPALADADGNFADNPDDDPNGIFLSGNLPIAGRGAGVHTLQDVPVFASGPGAAFFGRVLGNTDIFFGMAAAIGLDPTAAGDQADAGDQSKRIEQGGD